MIRILFSVLVTAVAILCGNAQQAPKRNSILIERFTTEQCGQCPKVDKPLAALKEVLKSQGYEVLDIEHHVGYHTDWLTLPECEELLFPFYGAFHFAPAASLNRWSPTLCTLGEGGQRCKPCRDRTHAVVLPLNVLKYDEQSLLDHAKLVAEVPSLAKIERIERVAELGDEAFSFEATIVLGEEFPEEEIYLTALVIQENILAKNQAGVPFGSRQYTHHNVIRSYATPALGLKLDRSMGKTIKVKLDEVSFKDSRIKDVKLEERFLLLILHQDITNEDIKARQIHDWATIKYGETLANEHLPASIDIEAQPYVEEGKLRFTVPVMHYELYDIAGRPVNAQTLVVGTYVLVYYTEGQKVTRKIIVP